MSSQVKVTYKELIDIIPEEKQLEFINLESGYVMSMTKWINENPMAIPKWKLKMKKTKRHS